MLSLTLATAAILLPIHAPAPQTATIQAGALLRGRVLSARNRPLAARLTLQRPGYDRPRAVAASTTTTGGGFTLLAPEPGLFVLRVEAEGCEPLELLALVDARTPLEMDCAPHPSGGTPPSPVCSEPRMAAWEAIHRTQTSHHARKARGENPDWKREMATVLKALDAEKDPATASLQAACYMDLGTLGAGLDSGVMARMLSLLPGESPFWSLNPGSIMDVINNISREQHDAFLRTMADRHADPACRSMAIYIPGGGGRQRIRCRGLASRLRSPPERAP